MKENKKEYKEGVDFVFEGKINAFNLIPTKNFKNNKYGSFNIVFKKEIFNKKPKGIENTVDFIEDDNYVYISSIELAQPLKGKGYGQAVYTKLNEYAKSKGKILHSDKTYSMTGSAANVWNALIKRGMAIKIADNEYRFKYDDGYNKHENKKDKNNSLEDKVISGLFILSFLTGIFLIPANLTGNITGISGTAHKLLGIILILIGISGFFIYRKLSNKS